MGFGLKIISGKGAGRVFRFSQASVRVGRQPDNDLVLYDMGVSRHHCEFGHDGDFYTLRDTGSANGTLVNDVISTEAQLKNGDRIGIGPVCFVFERDDRPAAQSEGRGGEHIEAFSMDEELDADASGDGETRARRPTEPKRGMSPAELELQDTPAEGARAHEHRTDTGSFVAHPGKGRRAFRRLPTSTRIAAAIGVAVVLGGGFASLYIVKNRPRADRSAEIFASDKANAALSFGSGKVDVNTPDRVNFQFDFKGGRVTVHFAAGGIDSPNELAVLLNGKQMTYVDVTPARWTVGLKIVLTRKLLKRGMNILTFDNTLTPAKDERWGVAQVRIEEEPLPPPDEKKAGELFELGRVAYDARSVAPPNLSRAIDYFEEARSYVEATDPPPPLYASILLAEESARLELQNVFDSYIFTVEKALRFNDTQGATETLRELLRYFPDAEDQRHVKAKNRLNEILSTPKP
jgi:hypothetical protein